MRFPNFLRAVLAALLLSATLAHAQWPTKPVRFVVPFPAGGSTDVVARIVAEHLRQGLGQSFVIDNRAGAGGTVGSDVVAKAAPDGYTMLIGTSSTHAIAAGLYGASCPTTRCATSRRSRCWGRRRSCWWCILRWRRRRCPS